MRRAPLADHAETAGQLGELVAGLATLLADPLGDELAAEEVVPDLLRRKLLGVEYA